MMRSGLLQKVAVAETSAMGVAKKHQLPLMKKMEMSTQGLPNMFGGGSMLSITPVILENEYGAFPGMQITSQDGWVCVLDQYAIDDLVLAFSKSKPVLESVYADLKQFGLIV
jgi:hypothetical protein